MKARLILCLLVVATLFSCKDSKETSTVEETKPTEVKVENKNAITLSNYSDENWNSGVGITYNMLLTDFSKEKETLIKGGKELELADGTILPYVGYQVVENFIQIQLNENATKYKAVVEYPNKIVIK